MVITITRNEKELGEWSTEEVRSLYQSGELVGTDYYWYEGMAEPKQLRMFVTPPRTEIPYVPRRRTPEPVSAGKRGANTTTPYFSSHRFSPRAVGIVSALIFLLVVIVIYVIASSFEEKGQSQPQPANADKLLSQ